jgi:transposase
LPLYRLEQIAARAGVTFARATLADGVGRYGLGLQPLADRLSELLKQRCLLHVEQTPVQQLDPGQSKTKRAYLCAYLRCDRR